MIGTGSRSAADRGWRTAVLAVGGLLVAIAVIGVVGIAINRNIHSTVEAAIEHDIELEDRGDDLRVAILEVRHYHRDLLLNNPDATRIDLWQGTYANLVAEIDNVEAVISRHPARDSLPDIERLRRMAEDYHADFAEAVADGISNRAAFERVAEALLVPISDMESVAIAIDHAGEQRATAAFAAINDATSTGTIALVGVIIGLGAMGGVLGYAVLRLVQEQRRLVAVEQESVARMAQAARAKTDFIADASHELRTPLTVLRGNAEIGLALGNGCAHEEILTEIVEESTRMSRLVDDLLFLARSDASSVPLEPRAVDAVELLEALVGRAEVLARERGALLSSTVTAAGSLVVDPGRIEQAVLVLVDNAAKYGPEGGTIDLEAHAGESGLRIEVRDRGPGIPADARERVFERFYRATAGARGRGGGGAGLGLPIAAAIVEGHGGRITVADRHGGGTLMTISVPARAAAAQEGAVEPAAGVDGR